MQSFSGGKGYILVLLKYVTLDSQQHLSGVLEKKPFYSENRAITHIVAVPRHFLTTSVSST